MENNYLKPRAFVLLAAAFSLSGCQKLIDRIFPHHDHPNESGCVISSIHQGDRIGTFYTNSWGDPDSVIFDTEMGSAGAQLFYYGYDDHHRLISYNAYYDRQPDNYYFKHKYVYSDDGKVLADTARIREAGAWTQVTFPEYDGEGRVIRDAGKVIEAEGDSTVSETMTLTFEYDSDGNLVNPNLDLTYDDKLSFLSTSHVLMFTERNYSNNNPVGATAYNDHDLPLGFTGPGFTFLQQGFPSEITYDCQGSWDY